MAKKIIFGLLVVIVGFIVYYFTYMSVYYEQYTNIINECVEKENFETLLKSDAHHDPVPVFSDETENCKVLIYKIAYNNTGENTIDEGFFFIVHHFGETTRNTISASISNAIEGTTETTTTVTTVEGDTEGVIDTSTKTSIIVNSGELKFTYPQDIEGSETTANVLENWINKFNLFPYYFFRKDANKYMKTEGAESAAENQNIAKIDSFQLTLPDGTVFYDSGDLSDALSYDAIDGQAIINEGIAPFADFNDEIMGSAFFPRLALSFLIFLVIMGLIGFFLFKPKKRFSYTKNSSPNPNMTPEERKEEIIKILDENPVQVQEEKKPATKKPTTRKPAAKKEQTNDKK